MEQRSKRFANLLYGTDRSDLFLTSESDVLNRFKVAFTFLNLSLRFIAVTEKTVRQCR